jgi:hypothetical protein
MKPHLLFATLLGALALGLAACAPAAPPPAPKAEEKPAAAAPAPGLASLAGRWGITEAACAPTNASRDGLIEIAAGTVKMGMDTCTVVSETPEPSEVTRIKVAAKCQGGEGANDERTITFVSSTPATLTWLNEGGTAEPYSRCP